jgi:copper chaperone
MSEHTYKFNVAMSCGGCSGAVERVLKKLDGMHSALRPISNLPLLPPNPSRLAASQLPTPPPSDRGNLLTLPLGVKSFNVDLGSQSAEVITEDDNLSYETVLEKIKKTGKKVNSGSVDGEEKSVE